MTHKSHASRSLELITIKICENKYDERSSDLPDEALQFERLSYLCYFGNI
jgi:hypothetical protein